MSKRGDLEWLDAAVVLVVLFIIGFGVWSLVFRSIPENQLAVLSSVLSALLGGVIGAYAGFRWATSKQASETIADMARASVNTAPLDVVVTNPPSDPVQTTEAQ